MLVTTSACRPGHIFSSAPRLRGEAVGDEVVALVRHVLEARHRAMVVGQQQAARRDEARRAAADLDRRQRGRGRATPGRAPSHARRGISPSGRHRRSTSPHRRAPRRGGGRFRRGAGRRGTWRYLSSELTFVPSRSFAERRRGTRAPAALDFARHERVRDAVFLALQFRDQRGRGIDLLERFLDRVGRHRRPCG